MTSSNEQIEYETTINYYDADERVSFVSSILPVGVAVHTTSGTDSLYWLLGESAVAGRPASADYLIDRDGHRHALCPPGRRPYHAGDSWARIYGEEFTDNKLSAMLLGVELEQYSTQDCTWQQLDSLADLIVQYGIGHGWRWPYFILGHYDIAIPMGRRSDPQNFNWGAFMGYLYARSLNAGVGGLYE